MSARNRKAAPATSRKERRIAPDANQAEGERQEHGGGQRQSRDRLTLAWGRGSEPGHHCDAAEDQNPRDERPEPLKASRGGGFAHPRAAT